MRYLPLLVAGSLISNLCVSQAQEKVRYDEIRNVNLALSKEEARLKSLLDAWRTERENWMLAYNRASAEDQTRLWEVRPDGKKTAQAVWNLIRRDLGKDWTAPGVAWFLSNPVELTKFPPPTPTKAMNSLLDSIDGSLANRPCARELCAPLAGFNHPRSRMMLENIFRVNEDKTIKGYAALGIALKLRGNGASDDPESVKLRGGYIKYALQNIKGDDFGAPFGRFKVVDIVREELYRLNNLTLMQKPPHIKAAAIDGQIFDTGAQDGKITVLLFWNPFLEETHTILEPMQKMYEKYSPQGVRIAVVCPAEAGLLKEVAEKNKLTIPMIADETRAIHTDYRMDAGAGAFVLDREGRIRFNKQPGALLEMMVEQLLQGRKGGKPGGKRASASR